MGVEDKNCLESATGVRGRNNEDGLYEIHFFAQVTQEMRASLWVIKCGRHYQQSIPCPRKNFFLQFQAFEYVRASKWTGRGLSLQGIWSVKRDNRGKQFDAPDKNKDILGADMTRGIVQSFVPLVQVLFSLKFESREDKGIE